MQMLKSMLSSCTITRCAAGMAVLPASYAAHVALQVALLPRVRAARAPPEGALLPGLLPAHGGGEPGAE